MNATASVLFAVALASPAAQLEERTTETKTFGPANLLIIDNVWGSVEVAGAGDPSVRVVVTKRIRAESQDRMEAAKREVRLDMSQSGDTVKLYVDGPFRCDCRGEGRSQRTGDHPGYTVAYDFQVRVPQDTRLDLHTVNDGRVYVDHVAGDFDIGNVNGAVELRGISGSGRAHTVNGAVTAAFERNPSGTTSFETVNGDLDVTLRKGLSADIWTGTWHGDIYTDFDVKALSPRPERAERTDGKFVYRRSGMAGVRIGSGGIEMKLKTLNGNIFIRSN